MGAATKNKGRPRIEESGRDFGLLDTIRETYPGISNRAAQNKLYQTIGSSYVIEHRSDIEHAELISYDNEATKSRYIPAEGIAEQIGRLIAQDRNEENGPFVLLVARKAAAMLYRGETVKAVEKWIREGRQRGISYFIEP